MVSRHEWARMCESPLADDSGVPMLVTPNTAPYPEKARGEKIRKHKELYELFLGCAELYDISDAAKVTAYQLAIEQVKELGLLGVSPYPLYPSKHAPCRDD